MGRALAVAVLCGAASLLPLEAQIRSMQIHGVPPSVTSLGSPFHPFAPGVLPSVTSFGTPLGFRPTPFVGGRVVFGGSHFRGVAVSRFSRRRIFLFAGPVPLFSAFPVAVPVEVPVAAQEPVPVVIQVVVPGQTAAQAPPDVAAERPVAAEKLPSAPAPPPTVLVMKDGQRLEVENYAVVEGTLYRFAEQRTWKIKLSDIDLPATVQVNEERGLEFRLPVTARVP